MIQRFDQGEGPADALKWSINDLIRRKVKCEIRPAACVEYEEKFDELVHFWGHCIEERNAPPVDNGKLCEASFSNYDERERVIDENVGDAEGREAFEELTRLTGEYFRLKDLVETYDTQFKTVKNQMRAICSGAQLKKASVKLATVGFSTRKTGGRIDADALANDHPELVEKYRKPSGKMLVMNVRRRQSEVNK